VEEEHAVSIAAAAAEAQANQRRRDEAHRVKMARLEQELQQATAVADDLREQLHERDQVILLLIYTKYSTTVALITALVVQHCNATVELVHLLFAGGNSEQCVS
jgi:hypothetical protein